MNPPAQLLLIFGGVCFVFAIFPIPIRADLDPTMARIALAVAITLLVAFLVDFCSGFRDGRNRSQSRKK